MRNTRFESSSTDRLRLEKAGFFRLPAGGVLVVFDPAGKRHGWRAKQAGIYRVEQPELNEGRGWIHVTQIRFGAEFAERGGPNYKTNFEHSFSFELPKCGS